MTPEEIQRFMALQTLLSQQPQQPVTAIPMPSTHETIAGGPPIPSGNPLLIGNDALRQQFYDHPELAPANSAQWLNDREQHLLGNDAPPVITATAPAPSAPPAPPPMLQQAPPSPAQGLSPPPAPQQPPMLPPGSQAAPAPMSAPPQSAPMLPSLQPAQITQLPQQAPVMSQVSPAPKVDAKANIDNSVTDPQRTFNPAYQPPPLPTFMNAGLAPNLGAYRPAPQMPGYAQARTGTPFMGPHPSAPQVQTFDNPFAAPQFSGPGGLTAGYSDPAQQPYDDNLFARLMQPRSLTY